MSDVAAPRWTLTIEPAANGQAQCSYAGHAEGVTRSEVAYFLVQALAGFTGGEPLRIMPTTAQMQAFVVRQQLLKDNPATTTYVRDGFSIYVGAIPEDQAARLKAAGWINGGAVPKGCAESCMFVTEREAFEAVCGPVGETVTVLADAE